MRNGPDITELIFRLITHLLNLLVGFCAFGLLLYSIHAYITDSGGDIEGLARLAEALGLKYIAIGVCVCLGGGAYFLERSGKKRAIRRLGKFRRRMERNDPDRSSSGLTETGDTPKPEDDRHVSH